MTLARTSDGWPSLIQGGMGIGVSDYRLARAVAECGCMGVVSGTALDTVFVRRLQLGDPSGHMRRALDQFAWPAVAQRILKDYFISGGKRSAQRFRLAPLPNANMTRARLELLVAANFVEVWLAKEGGGLVGINYLEKIQTPTLASLFGALLAGVDVVLMGAGIPLSIPGAIERLARFEAAELRLAVEGSSAGQTFHLRFDPRELFGLPPLLLSRPRFLAIVSSHIIAKTLVKKSNGIVDGFIVEDHTAGGHNAPPRKVRKPEAATGSDPRPSAPGFGPADAIDLAAFRELGKPFWLAGSAATPEKLSAALEAGARGVQVGTAFAMCDESGILPSIKRDMIERARSGRLRVVTDFEASPTGYPFKRVEREGAPEEIAALRARERVCDLGYLRRPYVDGTGRLGYRCPGEPVETFVKKGGDQAETVHKLCLCNQLLATIGLGQTRARLEELPVLTAGEELAEVIRFAKPGATSYTAKEVVASLLASPAALLEASQ